MYMKSDEKNLVEVSADSYKKQFEGKDVIILFKVISDGELIADNIPYKADINVNVTGRVETLVNEYGNVSTGSAGSIKTMQGNITCHDVTGDVENMTGNINCGKVSGSIDNLQGSIIIN